MPSSAPEPAAAYAELARLGAENAHLRQVLDHVPVGILIKDRDSRFLYMNAAGSIGYGVPRAKLIGLRERDVTPAGNALDDYLADDLRVIETGQPAVHPEVPFRDHNGTLQTLHISKFPIRFDGQPAVLVVVYERSDSTRVQQLERKVYEAQRLESLGVLAGGIAHDFNNLLVGVLANAELALRTLQSPARAAEYIERLRGAGLRLAELSGQMLAYSGRGKFASERVNLSQLVREMLGLVEATIPSRVKVHAELDEPLPAIECDPAQVRQVVMNLVTNAAEAIGERAGSVHVRTERVRFDPARHDSLTLGAQLPAADSVCLTVRDDGQGMSPHTRQHLFDPFFTTKSSGRGLGLAAVLGIVRSHRGALQVESLPGAGSAFRIWLPALSGPAARRADQPVRVATEPRHQRVLVVDDEDVVCEATSELLKSHGFEVETAADGDVALEVVRARGGFDAVVLDMSMPGPSPSTTHRALRDAQPELPIVLTSGFSAQEVLDELLQQSATVFLQKPYSTTKLVAALDALLRDAPR